MKTELVKELLTLLGWNRTKLAARLDITANTIDKWFMAGEVPGGPTSILLMTWLVLSRHSLPIDADELVELLEPRNGRKKEMAHV